MGRFQRFCRETTVDIRNLDQLFVDTFGKNKGKEVAVHKIATYTYIIRPMGTHAYFRKDDHLHDTESGYHFGGVSGLNKSNQQGSYSDNA